MQQYCNCSSSSPPTCCKNGWKLAFSNRRYPTTTESNHVPTERKALIVAWALKKARFFLLGCKHFTALADPKPLVKMFGDKTLHEISNPTLLNFNEKTLLHSFTVLYVK